MITGQPSTSTEGIERRSSQAGQNDVSAARAATTEQLRTEFDTWARNGWGSELELDNEYLNKYAVNLLELKANVRVLDLSCGPGLATRMIADRLITIGRPGMVTGMDISEGMLNLARQVSRAYTNLNYIQGSVDSIPSADDKFDEVICVESFYYYPDQGRALDEICRVMARQGRLYLLMRLYSDNPYADEFLSHLSIPAHVRSMEKYAAMLVEHGFQDVRASRVAEPHSRRGGGVGILRRGLKVLAVPPRWWVPSIREKLRITQKRDKARRIGALLLVATKR
jgi:ubiquinone/menaquinone biosynthesis C-methylase UbiE